MLRSGPEPRDTDHEEGSDRPTPVRTVSVGPTETGFHCLVNQSIRRWGSGDSSLLCGQTPPKEAAAARGVGEGDL